MKGDRASESGTLPLVTVSALALDEGLERHEAERLAALVTGFSRAALAQGFVLGEEEDQRFRELALRRRQGEPLQYVEGTVDFGPVVVGVDPRVLIPRPETEYMWEQAMAASRNPQLVLDLCTGSGCMALATKHERPRSKVIAVDVSEAALEVARANASRLELEVDFLAGDLFVPLASMLVHGFDLILCNPPYVSSGAFDTLAREIRDHEPREALVAGPRGDEVLLRVAGEAHRWLMPGGLIFCEIGEDQTRRAIDLFGRELDVEVRDDLTGRPRFAVGRGR